MSQKVRVRFAPSPTGPLHIGGVRTALYNYLFAKKHDGVFVLRIEDTDQSRYVDGAEKYIIDSLNWLNIPFDEGPGKEGKYGPYRQSERTEIYQRYVDQLLADGNAFYCFASAQELDQMRKEQMANGETPKYDGRGLLLSKEEVTKKLDQGLPYVVRMKVPKSGDCVFIDEIRGEIRIAWSQVDMQVLLKQDGLPTYH